MLPDPVAEQLAELATGADQTAASLAAQMVRNAVARAVKDGQVRPPKARGLLTCRRGGVRPAWLEPCGGDPSWRQGMWGAIVALYGRYPRQLENLKDDWWTDESHTETLCALAFWRQETDDSADDPREELAFQTQLADYSHTLRQEGGGVTKAWQPGAPPEQWSG